MKNKIIIVGSTNMDMVVKTGHIPKPGETVLGGEFFMNPGGKGANQAVAVARLGGDVTFIGKIGDDIFGKQAVQTFTEEGVDIDYLFSDEESPSGIALIIVDQKGENSIVVAPGANSKLSVENVKTVIDKYPSGKFLLVQLEIPMETVTYAVKYAAEKGMRVILNPAPAHSDLSPLLPDIHILTPNLNEAEFLSGIKIGNLDDAKLAAEVLHHKGVDTVIITLGKEGAAVLDRGDFYHIPVPEVKTVDSTAAGDVFNGALVVALSEGKTILEAVEFACQAAAISVTRMGAQTSIPYRNEVLLQQLK